MRKAHNPAGRGRCARPQGGPDLFRPVLLRCERDNDLRGAWLRRPGWAGLVAEADLPVTRQGHIQDLHNAHGLVDEFWRGAFGGADNRRVSRKSQQETVGKQLLVEARLGTGGYVRNRVLLQIGDQFGPRYDIGQLAKMNGSSAMTGGRRQRIDRGRGRRADMQDIVKVEDRCLHGVGGFLHRQDGR